MPEHIVCHLREQAVAQLPPWHADVIMRSRQPYFQAIYDFAPEHFVRGRACLLGDAACVARPHTGSGTTKAIQDAIALVADAFATEDSVERALVSYDQNRATVGRQFVELGRTFAGALVTGAPDWSSLDRESFREWFQYGPFGQSYVFINARDTEDR